VFYVREELLTGAIPRVLAILDKPGNNGELLLFPLFLTLPDPPANINILPHRAA